MDHCEKQKRKSHPRDRANFFRLITFVYMFGFFKKGFKNELEEDHLYEVVEVCNSKKCGDKIERIFNEEYGKKNPSITRLLCACFGLRYVIFGVMGCAWKLFRIIMEPYALGSLVTYFGPNPKITRTEAIIYANIVVWLNFLQCFYLHNYFMLIQQLAIEIRTSLSSLIYRKALKLTPSALSKVSLGNVVTLITKDVNAFEWAIWVVNDMWIGILQTALICYLLYTKMGTSSFIGIGFLLLVIPAQILMGKYVTKMRLTVNRKVDERLQIIQEILSSIRIIKMYTWETFFTKKVNDARKKEMNTILKVFCLKVIIMLSGVVCSRIGFYILLMSYLWMGNVVTAEVVFYAFSCFTQLRNTLAVMIPIGLANGAELYASISRINRLFKSEDLIKSKASEEITLKPKMLMKNVSVYINEHRILHDINLSINYGLTLVTGPVGCGKSSLVKTILQDYPICDGELETHGRMSYASQDPWLFPSSIRQNILFGERYNKTRYEEVIRVCALRYDLDILEKGDETIVADRGINLSRGQQARINLARAIYKESEIYLLDDSLTALDAHVQEYIFNQCIKDFLKDKICILITHNVSYISEADYVIVVQEGTIKSFGKPTEISVENITKLIGEDDDLEKEVISDDDEVKDNDKAIEAKEDSKMIEAEQMHSRKKVYHEVKKKGSIRFDIYLRYFKFAGGYGVLLAVCMLFLSAQYTESYSDRLLAKWVDLEQNLSSLILEGETNTTKYENLIEKNNRTFNLYTILLITSIGLSLLKFYFLRNASRKASIKIHNVMSRTIINSVMSFFDSHFIGNILNRFSQDLNNIDEYLPDVFSDCIRIFFAMCGIVILVLIVNWVFLIPTAFFFLFLVLMRMGYVPTGRSLKRLEAATRSPLVGHLNSSLEGLTTIRAYNAQSILKEEFDRHQDLYTSAHYSLMNCSRTFGFSTDFLCALFVASIVVRFMVFDADTSAGNVGLALTQVFNLVGLVQWGVRQWADLENQMTSVERVLEYTELKTENRIGQTLSNWPKSGAVRYENVTLTYSNNQQVLKDLNFSVLPGQKIGIVGRTGAGKSSIISSLFRLYEVEGKILVDDVNIRTLSLDFLRQSIAIIPQDPVLFAGPLRDNIDPFDKYSDEEIWQALEKVRIKPLIPSLDLKVTENGSNFSAGQRQLICLARAIIRKNKIVVLDEATANMDPETDELLHKIIKESFSKCTVFTIAHRLHSVMESNKIMVLDRGEIVEYNDPACLLENKDGVFYQMVEQSGLLSTIKK